MEPGNLLLRCRSSSSSTSQSLKELSKRFRHTLSDPNYVCPHGSSSSSVLLGSSGGGTSLLELRGLARRFGLKFNALRGRAVYLSTEAFYLEVKDSGEARLHVLSPESIEVLPPGEDLLEHLKGLMELRARDWVELSTLQEELKNSIGDDLIPRVGGTPAQIRLSPGYAPLEIRPHEDHFLLKLKEPLPLADELRAQLEKLLGGEGGRSLGLLDSSGEFLFNLLAPEGFLNICLPEQRHRYYFCQHIRGTRLSSIPFSNSSQIPEILRVLRHQALYNTLISSCGEKNSQDHHSSPSGPHVFEVSSLSLAHISVSFEHPDSEGIHAVEIRLSSGIRTRFFSASQDFPTSPELADAVLEQTSCLPVLMRMILKSSVDNLKPGAFARRAAGEKAVESSYESESAPVSNNSNSSYQIVSDPLNAKGPQEVGRFPGASPASPPSRLNPKKKTPSLSTKRKMEAESLKPVVSITPLLTPAPGGGGGGGHEQQACNDSSGRNGALSSSNSSSNSSPGASNSINPGSNNSAHSSSTSNNHNVSSSSNNNNHPLTHKVGIEIIPLGGKYSNSSKNTSSSSSSSSPRDIKRSLSEDDKRVKTLSSGSKKDKKRRHPSPLDSNNSKSCRGSPSSKKMKTSSSPTEGSMKESLKVTLKSSSSSSSSNSSGKSPKYGGSSSSSGSSGSSSSSSKTTPSSPKYPPSKKKERSAQEVEEVKRLLGGGKLLNKTFQIPKLSSSSSSSSANPSEDPHISSSKKPIPSLMSLAPSPLYGGPPKDNNISSISSSSSKHPSSSSSSSPNPPRFSSSASSINPMNTSSKSPSPTVSPRGSHPSSRRSSPSASKTTAILGDVVIEHIS